MSDTMPDTMPPGKASEDTIPGSTRDLSLNFDCDKPCGLSLVERSPAMGGGVFVVSVADTPHCATSGLAQGMRILAVDGVNTADSRALEVITLLGERQDEAQAWHLHSDGDPHSGSVVMSFCVKFTVDCALHTNGWKTDGTGAFVGFGGEGGVAAGWRECVFKDGAAGQETYHRPDCQGWKIMWELYVSPN